MEQEKCLKRKVSMCMCHTLYVDSLFVVLTYIYIIISIFFSTPNDKKKNDDETKEQSSKKRKVCMCMCHTLYAGSLYIVQDCRPHIHIHYHLYLLLRKAKSPEGTEKCHKSEDGKISCCGDWHNTNSTITQYEGSLDTYPMKIGDKLPQNPPLVRLNFKILKNAIEHVQHYYSLLSNKKGHKGKVKEYLQACGLQAKLGDRLADMLENDEPIDSIIPDIIKDPNISLGAFTFLPMHGFFLGVEKSLISKEFIPKPWFIQKSLKDILPGKTNAEYKIIVDTIKGSHTQIVSKIQIRQQHLSLAKIDWCHGVPFTSNDGDRLSTSGWLSENCIAFTRTSLVFFGYIDTVLDKVHHTPKSALESFKEMRVLWFCLVAHVFSDDKVESCVIGDYVKLFLSACAQYHDEIGRYGYKDGEGKTFFETTSNFLSLLNVEEACELFGSLRALWEGNDEKFIQSIKHELDGFRHTDEHMKVILLKMLRTKIFDIINKGNQFSQRTTYARTIDFKTYDNENDNERVLMDQHFLSGVIIEGDMYICFNAESGSARSEMPLLSLRRLQFTFTDEGCWNYNLWYQTISIEVPNKLTKQCTRQKVLEKSSDFFILFPLINDDSDEQTKFTVICKSWKIRDEDGELRLPTPRPDILNRTAHS